MKHISDEEWRDVFLAQERRREREEKELFEKSLKKMEQGPGIDVPSDFPSGRSKSLQRTIHKSFDPKIDAELDLHLKTKEESASLLIGFFRQAAGVGDRTVLVITGKGHHSEKKGVLREFVRRWLNNEGAKWILWFAEAPKKLGGSGAWLIRLKS